MSDGGAATLGRVTAEDMAKARNQGRAASRQVIETEAPDNPLLRLAWLVGLGHDKDETLKQAVFAARDAGATWPEIAQALNLSENGARSKYLYPKRPGGADPKYRKSS